MTQKQYWLLIYSCNKATLNYDDLLEPVEAMRKGNTAAISISERTYYLEALPEQDTFRMTDSAHREIPFNFSLSPEWKPEAIDLNAIVGSHKENEKHPFQKKKTGSKKGKGL